MGVNTHNGIGAQRDSRLRNGRRGNPKTYNLGVPIERGNYPLGLNPDVRHEDVVQGDFVSLENGRIVPLAERLGFAGVFERAGEDALGRYIGSIVVRGAFVAKVPGLNADTRTGSLVYAAPKGHALTLDPTGILIGEILAVENLEREMGIVCFKSKDDPRRLELGGARASR